MSDRHLLEAIRSFHSECGAPVVWVQYDSGKCRPPMEEYGDGMSAVIVPAGNKAYLGVAARQLRDHHCDPQLKREHQARRKKALAKLNEFNSAAWVDAFERPCPKCGADTYVKCKNMSNGESRGQLNRWPHRERYSEEFREREKM